jgi:hypothetical protein
MHQKGENVVHKPDPHSLVHHIIPFSPLFLLVLPVIDCDHADDDDDVSLFNQKLRANKQ